MNGMLSGGKDDLEKVSIGLAASHSCPTEAGTASEDMTPGASVPMTLVTGDGGTYTVDVMVRFYQHVYESPVLRMQMPR